MSDACANVMPSATPSEADIAAWEKLSREEQLKRLRQELAHPDCDVVATETMAEIFEEARQRAAKSDRG